MIEAEGRYRIVGILDASGPGAGSVSGYPVLGTDDEMPALAAAGRHFLMTIGQIKSPAARVRAFGRLASLGAVLATVAAPTAFVSGRARLGRGTIVMHRAVVNAGAVVGENCIVNTGAIVEHDAEVGSHCHVSTAAVVNGGARIGEGTFLGSGSVVLNQASVGRDCVVGAGAVVVGDAVGPGTYAGVPARRRG